jgi:hypothetical protein
LGTEEREPVGLKINDETADQGDNSGDTGENEGE